MSRGKSCPWTIFSLLTLLAGAANGLAQAPALQPAWNQLSPANNPGPRFLSTMTYDAAHGQVVLFSGNDASNDTWLWNGNNWSQASPQSSPPARWSAPMVYDAADGNVVLFGGDENGTLGQDTWLWNGSNWALASPANSPTPRDNCMMVYDAAQGEVVLFGGNVNGTPVNDTWIWQGGNWTLASPSSSPTARQMYSMVYDSALGEVILFGGTGSNGSSLSDTWAWNGTTWTQLNPANTPPGRYAQGMAYNPTLNQVVMFGGTNGSYLDDTWVFDGNTWSEVSTPANLQARLAFNGMVYDSAIEQVILYSGLSPLIDTWEFGSPSNFGNINVCPSNATTPAPCKETLTLTYNIATATAFGTPQVVTQGAANLDFTLAGGSTCTGTVAAGTSCTVNVTFTPMAPGLRSGAVELFDNGGNLLATSLIYGIGEASAIAFGPGTQTVVNIGSYSLTSPKGVAVDAAGDVFIADTHNHTGDGRVIKVANGTQTTVGVGLSYPQGLAIDGAGDLFVADNDLNAVVEIPAGCASSACQKTVGTGLSAQLGVAVDGAGDVFIGDFTGQKVAEVPANGGAQTIVYGPGTSSNPVGLAVDAAGDLFVADYGLHEIVKVPAGCASSSCQTTVGTGWSQVEGVAADAAGDVYVADAGLDEVVEVPAGCVSSGCQIVLASGIVSLGVAADAAGDVFIADVNNNRVVEINRSQPPSFSFATTNVGSISGDSPKSITALNVGNESLNAISPGLAVSGPNFVQVAGSGTPADCSSSLSLAPGAECNLSISFAPQTGGNPLNSAAVFTDNALNAAPAIQAIALSGVGLATNFTLTVTDLGTGNGTVTDNTGAINCSISKGSVTGTCSTSYQSGTVVQLTATPAAGSAFAGWSGAAQTGLPSISLTMNGTSAVSASFSPQSFGSVNVCQPGQSTPAPCSGTIAVTLNVYESATLGAIQVVTQGVAGLDFSQGSGGTCTGVITSGNSCVVNVNFTPLAPGLRMGAVNLYDENGNLAASTPVYGVGQAPAAAFSPSAQIPISTGLFPLSQPKGLLIDAAGNLFISDTNKLEVLKVAPNGSVTSIGSGFAFPQGMAEDGAGDLFIADNNLNQVVEIPAGCTTSACQHYVANPLNLSSQLGVAVDGAGDLFIGDFEENKVAEVPANGGAQTLVYNPTPGCGPYPNPGCSHPVDLTTDGAGDLFVADFGLQKVVEIPAGCTTAACQKSIGTGWSQPDGVAVDAAGDVYVADAGLDEVVEIPFGCASGACQVVMVSGVDTVAVKVDPSGDLVVDNLNGPQVFEVTRSLPPSLSFALTNVGSTSADSPQLISLQNVGNQSLTGTLALSLGTNFAQNSGSNCGSGFTLAPGVACAESFSFTPKSTGYQTGSASFSDNTMNLSALVSLQTINLIGNGGLNGQAVGVQVPNVVGLTQTAASTTITGTGLALGTVSTASSNVVPSGNVIASNPAAGTVVNPGSAVRLLVSTGQAPPPTPNPLSLLNNYFITGDFASAGVTLRASGAGHTASGTITIADSTTSPGAQGVPDGADIIDGYLYWTTVETSASASGGAGTFLGYPITGQQIGSDIAYTDGALSGTLRVYRADINNYFPVNQNGSGVRTGSGAFTVSFPNTSGTLTEGASLVVLYRVLSTSVPLKSIVIYDGSVVPASSTSQAMLGFYDALGSNGEGATLSYSAGAWSDSSTSIALAAHASQYSAPLNAGVAYAAVVLSTPVTNTDNDGILDAWKAGPAAGDFYAGGPGYYDVKTSQWVPLPGALHGQKDLFVQLDYMCGSVLANGSCDPSQENLFPAPDASGNDPLAMVKQAFATAPPYGPGIALHLQIGNAVQETTCTDSTSQLCQFPSEPGVIGWKNSLEFSKVWPKNLISCESGGDCSPRFAYGQKDSYHYVLFGHSLAIPAWNTRFQTLTAISVSGGVTTLTTVNRGAAGSINYCPTRITIAGVLGNPALNGVYNTTSCADAQHITLATPGVPNWTYPNNTMPEPGIGLTFGTVTSISGYSDLGGADSAVTLGLWETNPNQDMSKRSQVIAGTLFHEIGHTLGLGHGGIYYDNAPSYLPTFEENCKPNYQSIMNYLFQLDGVGPNASIAFSNQALETLTASSLASVASLTDSSAKAATFATSAWYTPTPPSPTASPATMHCDGTPLTGDTGYRVNGSVAPITPPWVNGQNITFDGVPPNGSIPFDPFPYTSLRGYNDVANLDLRQVGATGGEFASIAGVLTFGSSQSPLNIAPGGSVSVGAGGTVALGSGGTVTLGSGGNVTLGSGGTIALGSGGSVTLNQGGTVALGSGGTVALGSGGTVALGSGGTVTLGSGGTITMGSGGTVALGSGGTVTLGSGGTIALGSGGSVTIPSSGGSYTIPSSGGTITLGSGGTVALGSGGTVTLGSGGTIAMGSGGTVALGSGGTVTLGSGGTITLGSGGTVTMGSGGNVTLGSGGTITLGSGGTVTMGSGGNVTLGSGGTVTMGSGGNVTLGSGGTVTLGSGGTIALGSGGTITLGSGGTVTLGSGGTITLGSGGAPTSVGAGTYTLGSGGTVTMGSGGTVTLGSGGTVTLGSGGVVALGSGGTIALGSGGTIALGSGGTVTMGSGGASTTELDYNDANSVVRPPASPTYTVTSNGSIQVNWMAPAFGVVQTYTISRSVNGGTPVVIGSVSGVNGNPPATTFTDTNPLSGTLVYTIATTLVPDTSGSSSRQSGPSAPAVLTVNQNIVLGQLPSSVVLGSTQPTVVTATAESNGVANGLLVSFSATGQCSAGSSSINTSTGVSSSTITLTNTGSCTITASQAGDSATAASGTTAYNAAAPVSGTFTILPPGSTTQSQSINFGALPTAQYGGAFSVSATSTSGLAVSFSASGACTVNATTGTASGKGTAAGLCKITATAPANSTYSAASVTESFAVTPAPLAVTALNLSSVNGQPLPSLTPSINVNYSLTGFVNSDSASVVSGVPALSTTATSSSNAATYPITVATGTLAAANYSFIYVNGTLTIQQAAATISINDIPANPVYGGNFTATYAYSGTGSPTESVTSSTTAVCTVSGNTVKFVGNGTCTLQASATATTNYKAATGSQSFAVIKATLTVTANPASRVYGAANPAFSVTYGTFVNGDTSSVLSGSPTLSTTATATSLPGPYPINVAQGTLTATNYMFSFVSGTLTVTFTASAPASSTTCNGAYNGTYKGNLTVASGQNCVFVGGGTSGSITETGGNLVLNGATVSGSVSISGGTFSIGPSTAISGSLVIVSLPAGTTANQVCGAKISGSLQLESNKTPAVLGSGSSCAGNTIGSSLQIISNSAAVTLDGNSVTGSLQVESNSAATTTDSNTVGGSLQVISNTGAAQVFTNIVKGTLQCTSNSSITGSGNTAASKTGQCATF